MSSPYEDLEDMAQHRFENDRVSTDSEIEQAQLSEQMEATREDIVEIIRRLMPEAILIAMERKRADNKPTGTDWCRAQGVLS